MRSKIALIFFLSFLSFVTSADNEGTGKKKTDNFNYTKKDVQRGWFWYEDPKEKVEPKKLKPQITAPIKSKQPPSDEEIVINSAWLRTNLPKLQEIAQDAPTNENLAAYFYAQRLSIDIASRMANKAKEFFMFEEQLSETNRRPTADFALKEHKSVARENTVKMLAKIFEESGIWFFYLSNCPYCHKQLPALQVYKTYHKADVLGISMDGIVLAGDKVLEHKSDISLVMSNKFQVTVTPTMILVKKDGSGFKKISEGLLNMKDLTDRVIVAARHMNIITDEEFNYTRDVRNILVLKSATDEIRVNKQKLETKPGYLVEALRQRLEGTPKGTSLKVEK
jgi:conjugal transfer pilus assembly protein TraF